MTTIACDVTRYPLDSMLGTLPDRPVAPTKAIPGRFIRPRAIPPRVGKGAEQEIQGAVE